MSSLIPQAVAAYLIDTVVDATPGEPAIRIDWENLPGDIHRLAILVNLAGSEDEGDNIEFYESPGFSHMQFYDASEDVTGTIIWYPDGSGSITVPDYNGGQKACWDTQQYDADCI